VTDSSLCQEFEAAITTAGWSGDRRTSTEAAIEIWNERGHLPSDAALELVSNFNGIEFQYSRAHLPGTRPTDQCVMDVVMATRSIAAPVVRNYESRILEPLCPVGMAASGHLILLIAPSGRTYGGYDTFLARYGSGGFEALCAIFNGDKGAKID
jgi:hypothetical protein